MKHLKLYEDFNNTELPKFTNTSLNNLIKNARKWNEKDFIEEYVYLNNITTTEILNTIYKGDTVTLGRNVTDDNGKNVYKDGMQVYAPYKTLIADKYYGSSIWQFIMDNTKELQEEAKKLYHENKNIKKPNFKNTDKTMMGYHASPFKFKQFKYGENKVSGQVGAEFGFFFFENLKNAQYYASVLKDNHGTAYLYECEIKIGNQLIVNGVDVGTNWGRAGFLESSQAEGYDTVIIKNADTGYGITDEIVVFDDDNIKIKNISEI
jgi:hypothetical protein